MSHELSPEQGAAQAFSKKRTFDLRTLSSAEAYKLIIGSIIPRPIAVVSTINKRGETNLAPYSFFNGVCSNPPTLMISIARHPDGSKKDTLRNIEESEEFVVNTAHELMLGGVVQSAAAYPYGESEFEPSGLTPIPSEYVKPLRVKESQAQFECKVYKLVEIGDGSAGSSTVVFGNIVLLHVAEQLVDERLRINSAEFSPLSRLGGISYGSVGATIEKAVPKLS